MPGRSQHSAGTRHAGSEPKTVSNIMQNQFRLDDLLARDVVPQWFEGVAVVQLVCRQLRVEAGAASGFPHPENILIAPGGSVTITGGSDGKPVAAAAHVLGLMLGYDVPVRLRLSISQATATDSGFANLTEFSEALAYFERPNPESIVEAFRQRAMIATRREITPRVQTDAAPVIEKQPAPLPQPRRRRVSALAVIAAGGAVLACAAVWLIDNGGTGLLTPKVMPAETAEGTPATGQLTPKRTTAAAAERQAERVSRTAPTSGRMEPVPPRSVRAPAPDVQVVATTLSYGYPTLSPGSNFATYVSNLPTTIPGEFVTAHDVVAVEPTEVASDRIYSQADEQVTFPLSVYPKFPTDTPVGPGAGRTTLELTIAANGLVERVRMLTAPRNIHEFMLLSAAKAWRFEPARIGSRPVRFRQRITLTSLQ